MSKPDILFSYDFTNLRNNLFAQFCINTQRVGVERYPGNYGRALELYPNVIQTLARSFISPRISSCIIIGNRERQEDKLITKGNLIIPGNFLSAADGLTVNWNEVAYYFIGTNQGLAGELGIPPEKVEPVAFVYNAAKNQPTNGHNSFNEKDYKTIRELHPGLYLGFIYLQGNAIMLRLGTPQDPMIFEPVYQIGRM